MIDHLNGKIISKKPSRLIIDLNGISFDVLITLSLYETLPEVGESASVVTHLYIKENPMSLVLYGFVNEEERECFRNIISVSGIGPKTAISVLSGIGYKEFTSIILNSRVEQLTSVSGIGKKTAERLGLELKDKLAKYSDSAIERIKVSGNDELNKVNEITMALISLGYNKPEADNLVKRSYSSGSWNNTSIEEIIKNILSGK
jgi:Holliday junction DNA helicase RuvA